MDIEETLKVIEALDKDDDLGVFLEGQYVYVEGGPDRTTEASFSPRLSASDLKDLVSAYRELREAAERFIGEPCDHDDTCKRLDPSDCPFDLLAAAVRKAS
jgi:hypothetical protein